MIARKKNKQIRKDLIYRIIGDDMDWYDGYGDDWYSEWIFMVNTKNVCLIWSTQKVEEVVLNMVEDTVNIFLYIFIYNIYAYSQ